MYSPPPREDLPGAETEPKAGELTRAQLLQLQNEVLHARVGDEIAPAVATLVEDAEKHGFARFDIGSVYEEVARHLSATRVWKKGERLPQALDQLEQVVSSRDGRILIEAVDVLLAASPELLSDKTLRARVRKAGRQLQGARMSYPLEPGGSERFQAAMQALNALVNQISQIDEKITPVKKVPHGEPRFADAATVIKPTSEQPAVIQPPAQVSPGRAPRIEQRPSQRPAHQLTEDELMQRMLPKVGPRAAETSWTDLPKKIEEAPKRVDVALTTLEQVAAEGTNLFRIVEPVNVLVENEKYIDLVFALPRLRSIVEQLNPQMTHATRKPATEPAFIAWAQLRRMAASPTRAEFVQAQSPIERLRGWVKKTFGI
jgi:hypothetical protein